MADDKKNGGAHAKPGKPDQKESKGGGKHEKGGSK